MRAPGHGAAVAMANHVQQAVVAALHGGPIDGVLTLWRVVNIIARVWRYYTRALS